MPSGSDLFLAELFTLPEGPVGCCTPASFVLGGAFQVSAATPAHFRFSLTESLCRFFGPGFCVPAQVPLKGVGVGGESCPCE